MISYRQADLADRLKKTVIQPSPGLGKGNLRQRQIEDIDQRAPGHCQETYGRTTEQQFKEYADSDKELYWNICMDAAIQPKQDLISGKIVNTNTGEAEEYPANLIGRNVNVHAPTAHDDWNNEFQGRIVTHVVDDQYDVEDADENVYGMSRSQFDVVN